MKVYRETNLHGVITGYQMTNGTPENCTEYTYTEVDEAEYEAWKKEKGV